MREYNYNSEIKILLTQVLDALGNLTIKRFNDVTGVAEDSIHVNLRYSPKSRTIHDIVNKNQHIQLPVISLSISRIAYDSTRTFNKIAGFYTEIPSASAFAKHYQPLPVTIGLNLSILSRYQNDIDQIITNLFTFFHPYIVISYTHPEVEQEVRCVVQWGGDLSFQYPVDISANTPYRITVDTSLTVNGWIYRNHPNIQGKIYKIDHNFQSVNVFKDYYEMVKDKNQYTSDTIILSARPFINMVYPYVTIQGVSGNEFLIHGDMFHFVDSIYVSGTSGVYPSAAQVDVFGANSKLSALYPPFTGVKVENFEILGEKIAKFTLPTPDNEGKVTIIPVNEAGYGNLVVDAKRPYHNPYAPGTPEYDSYEEPQHPWSDGIEVVKT